MSDSMLSELRPPTPEIPTGNILPATDILVSEAASKLQPNKEKLVKKKINKWHAARVAFAGAVIPFVLSFVQVNPDQNFPATSESPVISRSYEPSETPTPNPEPTKSPTPPPTPRQLPDSPPASFFLKQTATVLEATGQRNSFREEAGFTKEMFESVKRATFIIEVWGEKETEGKKEIIGMAGTGWLAQSENNTYYVVTNRHVVLPEDAKTTGVILWRPNLDTEKFVPINFTIATTEDADIAVLKLQGDYHTTNPVEAIQWKDNVLLQKGDYDLIVGFPKEFRRENIELDHNTLGSVITIENAFSHTDGWYARGLFNIGSSGSPVIVNKNGHLVTIGMLSGVGDVALKNNNTEIQKQPIALIRPLHIRDLINALAQTKTE